MKGLDYNVCLLIQKYSYKAPVYPPRITFTDRSRCVLPVLCRCRNPEQYHDEANKPISMACYYHVGLGRL
jgi:hypothetical protein